MAGKKSRPAMVRASATKKGAAPLKTSCTESSGRTPATTKQFSPIGGRDQAQLGHLDDDDAEPDRAADAGHSEGAVGRRDGLAAVQGDDGGIDDRKRQDEHADRVHEHAEHGVGQQDQDEREKGALVERRDPFRERAGQIGEAEKSHVDQKPPR